MNRQKVIDWIIHRRQRFGRGMGWVGEIRSIGAIIAYALIVLLYFKLEVNIIWIVISCIFLTVFFITIGEIDYRKGIWKREALLATLTYNPYFSQLTKQIAFMDTKINEVINQNKQLNKDLKEIKTKPDKDLIKYYKNARRK